jgi:hypothetical protein
MLGHLCNTFCHCSGIGFRWQARFLALKEVLKEAAMLETGKLTGFLATTDYDKARKFYERKLDFKSVSLDQYALVMSVGEHGIRISKIPNFTPRQGTVLGWEVPDIERRPHAGCEIAVSLWRNIPSFRTRS